MASEGAAGTPQPIRVMVAVCTFRRNEPLRALLAAVERNAEQLGRRATVGVVVVDDNPDGRAETVCGEFATRFDGGMHYRRSGLGNISIARNLALEAALPLADRVALTDDDCVPVDSWLSSYLDAWDPHETGALTGPCHLEPAPGAPSWLTDEPFLDDAQFRFPDGTDMDVGATNNSFLDAGFFRDRPELRFAEELGVVGGEDMVFFKTAKRHGLSIRFVASAIVQGREPPDRCTFRYQLRSRFWLGNTEWVTNRTVGDARRPWWVLRSVKLFASAAARPLARMARREAPQLRYSMAIAARSAGMLAGAMGLRVRHH